MEGGLVNGRLENKKAESDRSNSAICFKRIT